MNCDNFERALFYTDFPAKTFKKADKLRQLLYKQIANLHSQHYIDCDVEKTINRVFYLCAKLYVDDAPENSIFEDYVCHINRDPSIPIARQGMLHDDVVISCLLYEVLSVQETLPENIQYFMPCLKNAIERFEFFETAENQIDEWKHLYGLFMTDIAPNPNLKVLLQEIDDEKYGDRQSAILCGDIKRNLEFLYPEFTKEVIESRIRLFRESRDQALFVHHTFTQYYKFVFGWPVNPNCKIRDDIKQEYMARIEAGAYLPHYPFLFSAIPLPKETDAAEDEDDAEALRKQCEQYSANLKEREEEIGRLKNENEDLKKELVELKIQLKGKDDTIEELNRKASSAQVLINIESSNATSVHEIHDNNQVNYNRQ